MIVGLGIDLVELPRMEHIYRRFHEKFLIKFLAREEIELLTHHPISWIGGRFAAKEAAAKALGTGFAHGVFMTDIRILPDSMGRPCLYFHSGAKRRLEEIGARKSHLSITHERNLAMAQVILED